MSDNYSHDVDASPPVEPQQPATQTIIEICTLLGDLRPYGYTFSLDLRDESISLAVWDRTNGTRCFSDKQAAAFANGIAPVLGTSMVLYSDDNQDGLYDISHKLSVILRECEGVRDDF